MRIWPNPDITQQLLHEVALQTEAKNQYGEVMNRGLSYKVCLAILALALACFSRVAPAWSCDDECPGGNCNPCGEDPENPECPDTDLDCEPYTTTYQHGEGNALYNCVDTYEPCTPTVQEGEQCCYKLASHECDYCGRWWGCFDPNTEILMGDKTTKRVSAIKDGDFVWNPLAAQAMRVTKRVAGPEEIPMIEIRYNGKTIRVTQDHPMVVKNTAVAASMNVNAAADTGYGIKQARDLSKDDLLLGPDGLYHQIEFAAEAPLKAHQTVINFELAAPSGSIQDHAVVANGIVTGDLAVQVNLKKEQSF